MRREEPWISPRPVPIRPNASPTPARRAADRTPPPYRTLPSTNGTS